MDPIFGAPLQPRTLPNEIIVQIAQDLGTSFDHSTLIGVSLLNHFLRIDCIPKIFENITFSTHSFGCDPLYPSRTRFCTALSVGNQEACSLALHIKNCLIIDIQLPYSNLITNDFASVYFRTMSRLENLQSICFRDVGVSMKFIQPLSHIRTLQELSMESCFLQQQPSSSDSISPNLILNLSSFTLRWFSCADSSFIRDVSCMLNRRSLRILKTDSSMFLREITSAMAIEELEIFSLELVDLPFLGRFLERHSFITKLSINELREMRDKPNYTRSPLEMSNWSLPHLEVLKCPPFLSLELISGRTPKSIDITGFMRTRGPHNRRNLHEIPTDFRLDVFTEPLVSLHVTEWFYRDVCIGDYFSVIDTLLMSIDQEHHDSCVSYGWLQISLASLLIREKLIYSICNRWAKVPSIGAFIIKDGKEACSSSLLLNLDSQHELVTAIAKTFPDVTHICLSLGVEWRREDNMCNQWVASLGALAARNRLRGEIIASLPPETSKCRGVKDFQGLLASLFEPPALDDSLRSVLGLPSCMAVGCTLVHEERKNGV